MLSYICLFFLKQIHVENFQKKQGTEVLLTGCGCGALLRMKEKLRNDIFLVDSDLSKNEETQVNNMP